MLEDLVAGVLDPRVALGLFAGALLFVLSVALMG
jgi:hypothetical protein